MGVLHWKHNISCFALWYVSVSYTPHFDMLVFHVYVDVHFCLKPSNFCSLSKIWWDHALSLLPILFTSRSPRPFPRQNPHTAKFHDDTTMKWDLRPLGFHGARLESGKSKVLLNHIPERWDFSSSFSSSKSRTVKSVYKLFHGSISQWNLKAWEFYSWNNWGCPDPKSCKVRFLIH